MTARTGPVHGEYSATGICRWCEPLPVPRCRCGEYAWTNPREEPKAVIDGVAHSPEQCFKLAGELPGASALRDVDELAAWYDWTRVDAVELLDGLPPIVVCPDNITAAMHELWLRLNTRGGATAFFPHTLVLADESRLAEEHAALRWERVARRWGSKHPTMLDLANGWGRFVVEAMREHVKKLARTNPLLQDKLPESK